jgi:hypothetical protein
MQEDGSMLDVKETLAPAVPPRRLVLLGASNVTRSISVALASAQQRAGSPLEILAAFGHGRSYGKRMRLLLRELPGIRECALWDELSRRPPLPTAAILTDIGNDLLYDVSPEQIAEWVGDCVERLQRAGARVTLTPLPLCSADRLSPRAYLIARSLLFPFCRIDFATIMQRAHDLDAHIRALARKYDVALVEHRREWYGFDPIHIRRPYWREAWHELFQHWGGDAPTREVSSSLRRWLYLQTRSEERRWWLGREVRTPQPHGRFEDGTTLALY